DLVGTRVGCVSREGRRGHPRILRTAWATMFTLPTRRGARRHLAGRTSNHSGNVVSTTEVSAIGREPDVTDVSPTAGALPVLVGFELSSSLQATMTVVANTGTSG